MTVLFDLFLGKYAKYVWIMVALSGCFLYWKSKLDTIKDLSNQLHTIHSQHLLEITLYETNIATLKSTIAIQNSAIIHSNKQYTSLNDQIAALIKENGQKHNTIDNDSTSKIDHIENQQPKTCQQAIDLLVDSIIMNKW